MISNGAQVIAQPAEDPVINGSRCGIPAADSRV